MGILDNIGKGKKPSTPSTGGTSSPARTGAARAQGLGPKATGQSAASIARARRDSKTGTKGGTPKGGGVASRLPGRRKGKGTSASPRERIASAAAPLHDRRRRLVGARETTLRDLGGLMLEMYKRNRFREELLLDKCEEVLAIEVEIAHVDQRLFQLAPPNAAGMRPIGRCECGAPIHPGQNFCGVCGRSFATLTQSRSCVRCGGGLRPGDQFCAVCGTEAPDALQSIEPPPPTGGTPTIPHVDAGAIAASAVADTLVIDVPPPLDEQGGSSSPAMPSPAAAMDAADVVLPPVIEMPPIELDTPGASMPAGATSAMKSAPSEEQVADTPAELAQPAPAGFDWTAPPAAPDAAIDAAMDALPPSPTDPATPFAGFPLSSTVPPPPIIDPIDEALPEPTQATDVPQGDALEAPAPAGGRTMFGRRVSTMPGTGDAKANAPKPSKAEKPPKPPKAEKPPKAPKPAKAPKSAMPTPTPPAPDATALPAADPAKAATAAEREAKKTLAAEQKQRAKDAKARAKARAKAAREQRKRGGGS